MDVTTMIEDLKTLKPVELKGASLLAEARARTGQLFPDPGRAEIRREQKVEALTEMIVYSEGCQHLINRVQELPAAALDESLAEYSL